MLMCKKLLFYSFLVALVCCHADGLASSNLSILKLQITQPMSNVFRSTFYVF